MKVHQREKDVLLSPLYILVALDLGQYSQFDNCEYHELGFTRHD